MKQKKLLIFVFSVSSVIGIILLLTFLSSGSIILLKNNSFINNSNFNGETSKTQQEVNFYVDNNIPLKYQSNSLNFTIKAKIPDIIEEPYSYTVEKLKDDIVFFTEEEQMMQIKKDIPNATTTYNLALEYLTQYGGLPKDAKLNNYEEVYLKKVEEKSLKIVDKYPLWSAIKFKRTLNGFPVVGPGGEIDIALGEEGQLLGLSKIWRTIVNEEKTPIITPEEAINKLYSGDTVNKLQDTNDISINKIEIGYYEFGANQKQDVIKPVWIFSGNDIYNNWVYICVDATKP